MPVKRTGLDAEAAETIIHRGGMQELSDDEIKQQLIFYAAEASQRTGTEGGRETEVLPPERDVAEAQDIVDAEASYSTKEMTDEEKKFTPTLGHKVRCMKKLLLSSVSLFTLLLISLSSNAHHSFGVHYDPAGKAQIEGILKRVRIRSPHSILDVEVTNENGKAEQWRIETHSVPLLKRVGLTKDVFDIDKKITIAGMPSRVKGRKLLFGLVYIMHDGRRYEWRPDTLVPEGGLSEFAKIAALSGVNRFAGVWGYKADPNPHTKAESPYPLNKAGLDARAAFNPLDTPAMRCIPPNLPTMLYVPYLYGIQVEDKEILFQHEYFSVTRKVPLSNTAAATESSGMFGSAKGMIEGNTIIVESSGFPDLEAGMATDFDPNGVGADVPSSEKKNFKEVYSLSDDGQTMYVDYTVEDPVYLTKAYTSRTEFSRLAENTTIEPFECDAEVASQSSSQKD